MTLLCLAAMLKRTDEFQAVHPSSWESILLAMSTRALSVVLVALTKACQCSMPGHASAGLSSAFLMNLTSEAVMHPRVCEGRWNGA